MQFSTVNRTFGKLFFIFHFHFEHGGQWIIQQNKKTINVDEISDGNSRLFNLSDLVTPIHIV